MELDEIDSVGRHSCRGDCLQRVTTDLVVDDGTTGLYFGTRRHFDTRESL